MTEQLRECDRCGWNFLTEGVERLCAHCTTKLEEQVGQCGHSPEVICRECHPEAFDNAIRSPVYYHAECGCELRDDTKVKWCPYHVSGLQETIKARERENSELRIENKILRKDVKDWQAMFQTAIASRDEWREKAEAAEMGEDASASMIAAICAYAGIENDPNGTPDAFANNVIHRVRELETERDTLKTEVDWRWKGYLKLSDLFEEVRDERDEWKAKAELAEAGLEGRDAAIQNLKDQKASILRNNLDLFDENRGLRSDIHGKSKELQEWKAKAERYEQENDALQDAVKHLREQIPDVSSNATMWKAKAEQMERAQEVTHRALEAEIERTATHWCCMHQRWETREGAEV